MSTRVLVTHADEPIGRRVVKNLFHDPEIEQIWALGRGRQPRALEGPLRGSGGRLRYARVDLAKHRSVSDFFHSPQLRAARIDSLIHVPCHGPATPQERRPLPGRVAERTAEARLVLQSCLESASIRRLVAIGSAFVYRLEPGNANVFTEESQLDLDPDVPAEIRSWIDCDMILHGEVHNSRLRVTLLRVPTVVASGGYVYLNPSLTGASRTRFRPLGFDPVCSLIADKDVARASVLALHRGRAGVYNVAGRERVPFSTLARWTGAAPTPAPGPLLRLGARAAELLGAQSLVPRLEGPHLQFGYSLDIRRAEAELGFVPGYRVGLSQSGDGRLRIETAPA